LVVKKIDWLMRTRLQNIKSIMIKFAIVFGVIAVSVLLMKKKDMSYRQSILKTMYPVIMFPGKLVGAKNASKLNTDNKQPQKDFYALNAVLNNGDTLSFESFRGKKVLLVNTASDCGYTGQYKELETLYQQYKNNLIVVGFPANDFKEQEKKSDADIATFCKVNYGVTFLLMRKGSVVKGSEQQTVYQWLSNAGANGWCNQAPVWNFCKYVVSEEGVLQAYFPQTVSPLDQAVVSQIQ
jgi:glutathione peroxidase